MPWYYPMPCLCSSVYITLNVFQNSELFVAIKCFSPREHTEEVLWAVTSVHGSEPTEHEHWSPSMAKPVEHACERLPLTEQLTSLWLHAHKRGMKIIYWYASNGSNCAKQIHFSVFVTQLLLCIAVHFIMDVKKVFLGHWVPHEIAMPLLQVGLGINKNKFRTSRSYPLPWLAQWNNVAFTLLNGGKQLLSCNFCFVSPPPKAYQTVTPSRDMYRTMDIVYHCNPLQRRHTVKPIIRPISCSPYRGDTLSCSRVLCSGTACCAN